MSISYSFTGTFTSSSAPEDERAKLGLTPGGQVTGRFGWEFNQAPLWEGSDSKYDPYRVGGRSEAPDAYFRVWYELAFDGVTVTGKAGYDTPSIPFSYPRVFVGNGDAYDYVTLFDHFNRTDIGTSSGIDMVSLSFSFSPDAFSDTSVPSVLDPSKLLPGHLSIQTHRYLLGAWPIDSMSELKQVPEPMTLTLVGVGIAVAAMQRRRARGDR